MDPLTILAAAQAAYSAIQAGIAAGKEIQGMAADLSDLWGSVAKLTHIAADKPSTNVFSNKSAEQIAMERYAAKAEAQDLAMKAKNMFVGRFGLNAWDQVQKEVIEIRKEIERQKHIEEREAEVRAEEVREVAVVGFIVLVLLGIMLLVGIILSEGKV